jgi:hypothetical protein
MRGRLRKGTVHMAKQIEDAPMPIAINASVSACIEGPHPGALMMCRAQEPQLTVEARGAETRISRRSPSKKRRRPKIVLFESDLKKHQFYKKQSNAPEEFMNVSLKTS